MGEITQKIGFDASKALETLAALDNALKAYNQGLNSSVGAMKSFNSMAGKTVSALMKIASAGKAATEQMQKVASIQGKVTTAPAGKKTTKGIGGQVGKIDSNANTNNMNTSLWKTILDSQLKRNAKDTRN